MKQRVSSRLFESRARRDYSLTSLGMYFLFLSVRFVLLPLSEETLVSFIQRTRIRVAVYYDLWFSYLLPMFYVTVVVRFSFFNGSSFANVDQHFPWF